jgi:hypothetical protein
MDVPLGNDLTTKYKIVIRGTVAADFAKDIGAPRCEPSQGKTVIVVDVLDQSHLHGILESRRSQRRDREREPRVMAGNVGSVERAPMCSIRHQSAVSNMERPCG